MNMTSYTLETFTTYTPIMVRNNTKKVLVELWVVYPRIQKLAGGGSLWRIASTKSGHGPSYGLQLGQYWCYGPKKKSPSTLEASKPILGDFRFFFFLVHPLAMACNFLVHPLGDFLIIFVGEGGAELPPLN